MSTIKVDTVRPVTADASLTLQGDNSGTGVSGITIDSSGNAAFAQNAKVDTVRPNTTDGSLTLQGDSSGSGVTGITIDSSGNATFAGTSNNLGTVTAGTIGGNVAMASSGLTVRNITNVLLASDQELVNSTTLTTFFSPTYTPLFSGSKVQGILTFQGQFWNNAAADGRKRIIIEFTGSGITDYSTINVPNAGAYDYGGSGFEMGNYQSIVGGLITTTTTDVITANCKAKNEVSSASAKWRFFGNDTTEETFFTWIEYK